jgi:dTDP-4-amino-4,6-dideoxygalactose transaminase
MTEVCAAMGLTNLAGIEDLMAVNRRNYDVLPRRLGRHSRRCSAAVRDSG